MGMILLTVFVIVWLGVKGSSHVIDMIRQIRMWANLERKMQVEADQCIDRNLHSILAGNTLPVSDLGPWEKTWFLQRVDERVRPHGLCAVWYTDHAYHPTYWLRFERVPEPIRP